MPDETAPLPNLWHVYNLRESPYFQATLGGEPDRYPLSLFVGRRAEARRNTVLIATLDEREYIIRG